MILDFIEVLIDVFKFFPFITHAPSERSVGLQMDFFCLFLLLLLPLPHLQSFVSLRYSTFMLGTENAMGGGGAWVFGSVCHLVFFSMLDGWGGGGVIGGGGW